MTTILTINWFTPILLLTIYGGVRYFRKPQNWDELVDEQKGERVGWTPLESVGVTLAIYFIGQLLGLLIFLLLYALLASLFGAHDITYFFQSLKTTTDVVTNFTLRPFPQFMQIFCMEAVTLTLLIIFLRLRKTGLKVIGLRKPKWRDLAYVAMGYLTYFVVNIGILGVVDKLAPGLNANQKQEIGFQGAHGAQLTWVFLALVILPPFVEELLVRGFLYSGLKNKLPKLWAVLITGLLFAMAHLQAGNGQPLLWTAAIDTFILSTLLIYLREKTGSLWASIGLHALKNGVAFLTLFIFHIA